MISVTISGIDQFSIKLSKAVDNLTPTLDQAVQVAAQTLGDETKKLPPVSAKTTGYGVKGMPVDSGLTRQSIQVQKQKLLAADIVATTKYAKFVYWGTAKMPARPFFQYAYELGGGEKIKQIFQTYLSRLFE
jgi:HK97 gp10 family phage protein